MAVRDQAADQFLRARLEHDARLDADRAEQPEEVIARIGQIEQDEGIVGQFGQTSDLRFASGWFAATIAYGGKSISGWDWMSSGTANQ